MDGALREQLRQEISEIVHLRVEVEQLARRVERVERSIEPWRWSLRGVTEHRRDAVAQMRSQGFSMAAIASALGVALATVERDLACTPHEAPEFVRGLDHKMHPSTKRRRNGGVPSTS